MSYDTVLKFKIDKKRLTITGRFRSSNSWDWNGKRTVSDYTEIYDNLEDFKKGIFDFADNALSGSLRFSKSSTMSKRLNYLLQNNKLVYAYPEKAKSNNPEDEWYKNWFAVNRDDATYQILVGEKAVKPKVWIISDGNSIGVKETLHYTKLSYDRWTKFYSLESARKMMERLKELDWVDRYHLKISEV